MMIKRDVAVGFLVALGFAKAMEWEAEKLQKLTSQIPEKVQEGDVPQEYLGVYADLCAAAANKAEIKVEFPTPKPVAATPSKKGKVSSEKPAASGKPPVKPKAKAAPASPATDKKGKAAPSRPSKTPVEKKSPKEKHARGGQPLKERDSFGCIVGSLSAKVNAAMTGEWQDENEIKKACGLDLRLTRNRLYLATEKGLFESKRSFQYRIKPEAVKKAE